MFGTRLRLWTLVLICVPLCVDADHVFVRNQKMMDEFRTTCHDVCHGVLFSETSLDSLVFLRNHLPEAGRATALIDRDKIAEFKDHPVPSVIEVYGRAAHARVLSAQNRFRYEEVAGRMDTMTKPLRVFVLGQVLKTSTVSQIIFKEADAHPEIDYVYLDANPNHLPAPIARVHKQMARAWGALGHNHTVIDMQGRRVLEKRTFGMYTDYEYRPHASHRGRGARKRDSP